MEPKYLKQARKYVGLKETPGATTNPTIQGWLKALKAPWTDDETAWCGTFVAAMMLESGLTSGAWPKTYYRAKDWAVAGTHLTGPKLGAVAVLTRVGGGHVGFVTGVSKDGLKTRLLGGNQGNSVSEAWFDTNRIIAYRSFAGYELQDAPIAVVGTMSKSEA